MYKVLIVEDDINMRFTYSKMKAWKECNFEVSKILEDCKKTVEVLQADHYDMVFIGSGISAINSLTLLNQLKDCNITIPMIICADYNQITYVYKDLNLEDIEFIEEPITEQKILSVLEDIKCKIAKYRYSVSNKEFIRTAIERCNANINDDFTNSVCEYILDRLNETITLSDVAYNYSMNREDFNAKFKESSGVIFSVFLHTVKMEYAKKLIENSNLKNYEVADMLGYSTPDYFTKIFKECTGTTPTSFRKRCRQSKLLSA